jgi:hypothetical protein
MATRHPQILVYSMVTSATRLTQRGRLGPLDKTFRPRERQRTPRMAFFLLDQRRLPGRLHLAFAISAG